MNCKPGDLAMVRGPSWVLEKHLNGTIVRCVSLMHDSAGPWWVVEPQPKDLFGIWDRFLVPIRGGDLSEEVSTRTAQPTPIAAPA